MRWLLLLALGACLNPAAVPCSDGDLCPPGTECRAVTNPDQKLCASTDQLAQCDGKPDYTRCMPNGRCYSGVCLPVVCGNGRVDKPDPNDPMDTGEGCDDGNQTSGDGCSADCLSDETCGNGHLDPVANELCDDGNLVDHDGCDSACGQERPKWTQLTFGVPTPRVAYAMAYDAAREKVVLFGGVDPTTGTLLGDTWEWNGAGWQQFATTEAPSPRAASGMVYDAAHREIVLYGGGTGPPNGYSTETWTWNGKHWTPIVTITNPGARAAFSMTYDSARKRVVVVGGTIQTNTLFISSDETWDWDGATWTKAMPATKPPPDATGAAAYDPIRGVVVYFGGSANPSTNAVWEYDGTTWRSIAPSGTWPARRNGEALAWDPVSKRVILFGGSVNSTDSKETWAWDGVKWTSLTTPAGLSARSSMSAVTDPVRGRVMTYSGTDTADLDSWEWNGTTWLDVPAQKPSPEATIATYDSLRGRVVLVDTTSTVATRVWEYDGFAWQAITAAGPVPASGAGTALAYDSLHHQVVMFGGANDDTRTWLYDGAAWSVITTPGPSAREDVAMAFDASRGKVVLYGGYHSPDTYADTWEWNGATWTQLTPTTAPSQRASAAMAYDPDRKQLIMFGGGDGSVNGSNETWTFDGTDWRLLAPAMSPQPRVGGRMTWYPARHRLVMFGGRSPTTWVNDTWEWTGSTWEMIPVAVVPNQRTATSMFPLLDGSVGIFGGAYGVSFNFRTYNDTWRLSWDGNSPGVNSCRAPLDEDGDGTAGCADGDCALTCAGCSDGVCAPTIESCRICPGDCTCTARCGDFYCDAPETHATCPGDCP